MNFINNCGTTEITLPTLTLLNKELSLADTEIHDSWIQIESGIAAAHCAQCGIQ